MKSKKLTLDKSILARLQDDQLAAVEGGQDTCESQVANSTITIDLETARIQEAQGDSCCRKSC
jgi:hypothetical protein